MHASNAFVDPAFIPAAESYQALIDQGYRRSGDHLYKPVCLSCNACIPCRVDTSRFSLSRSQKRCWKRNADLQVELQPASFSDERFALYRKYLNSRHADGDMANPDKESFRNFLFAKWSNTLFVEFRLHGKLVSVAVVDVLPRGYSAVYTFFDPQYSRRSPGTYAVLWEIEHARMQGLPYVYLGYWIEESPKMNYKSHFQPLEILQDGHWQAFAEDTPSDTPKPHENISGTIGYE
jgi:arginine-tRNA-protein transferase